MAECNDHATRPLSVVVVGDLLAGFPYGYAYTRYIRLLAKSMAMNGSGVYLPIPLWSFGSFADNAKVKGVSDGILFEHVAGVVSGDFSFFMRQWLKTRSWLMLGFRLLNMAINREIDAIVYVPWTFRYLRLLGLISRTCRIPLFVNISEWPQSWEELDTKKKRWFDKKYRATLSRVCGAIVISEYIQEQCQALFTESGGSKEVLKVPILVDPTAWSVISPAQRSKPYFLYCAALDGYINDALMVLDAFAQVSQNDYDLILVGSASLETRNILQHRAVAHGIDKRVVILDTFVPDADLLALYAGATALLAPLKDNDRNRARFPSKLADYLYSGTPVITNGVGDVPLYLQDEHSAFIAPGYTAAGYAEKLQRIMTFPELARNVGLKGKNVAERNFSLTEHGLRLNAFIRAQLQDFERL